MYCLVSKTFPDHPKFHTVGCLQNDKDRCIIKPKRPYLKTDSQRTHHHKSRWKWDGCWGRLKRWLQRRRLPTFNDNRLFITDRSCAGTHCCKQHDINQPQTEWDKDTWLNCYSVTKICDWFAIIQALISLRFITAWSPPPPRNPYVCGLVSNQQQILETPNEHFLINGKKFVKQSRRLMTDTRDQNFQSQSYN